MMCGDASGFFFFPSTRQIRIMKTPRIPILYFLPSGFLISKISNGRIKELEELLPKYVLFLLNRHVKLLL